MTFKFFSPILVGAQLSERLIGCLGALVAISMTGLICALAFGAGAQTPLIVAPIGASAVLLLAVPASPLAQPWPIIGGNTLSALAGVIVAHLVAEPTVAIGLSVALAILTMSLTRCLHPPGGAAALTAVIGGAAVTKFGFWFPIFPVAVNSILLVSLGVVFHRVVGRNYPHRAPAAPVNTHKTADPAPDRRIGFDDADINAALAESGEALDISRSDLDALLRQVELHALQRKRGDIRCADIMSRDVATIGEDGLPEEAMRLLLHHDIRALPVLDRQGRLAGVVGLRDLVANPQSRLPVRPAYTAGANDAAAGLLPHFTDGATHAVIIIDNAGRVEGVVSQTDLLAALAKPHFSASSA